MVKAVPSFLLFVVFALVVEGFAPILQGLKSTKPSRGIPLLSRSLGPLQEYQLVQEGYESISLENATTIDCLVDFGNFWRKTQANFTACEPPERPPDFKSKGAGGSRYWDMGDHVVRHSNHWSGQHGVGRIVDCEWAIDISHGKKEYVTGKCHYTSFRKGKLTDKEKRKLCRHQQQRKKR
jgi:hypothetical protein